MRHVRKLMLPAIGREHVFFVGVRVCLVYFTQFFWWMDCLNLPRQIKSNPETSVSPGCFSDFYDFQAHQASRGRHFRKPKALLLRSRILLGMGPDGTGWGLVGALAEQLQIQKFSESGAKQTTSSAPPDRETWVDKSGQEMKTASRTMREAVMVQEGSDLLARFSGNSSTTSSRMPIRT